MYIIHVHVHTVVCVCRWSTADSQGAFVPPPRVPRPRKSAMPADPMDEDEDDKDKKIVALDEGDIALLKTYVRSPCTHATEPAALGSLSCAVTGRRASDRTTRGWRRLRAISRASTERLTTWWASRSRTPVSRRRRSGTWCRTSR